MCVCVSSGSQCVGVMSEENGSKGSIARLSVSKVVVVGGVFGSYV